MNKPMTRPLEMPQADICEQHALIRLASGHVANIHRKKTSTIYHLPYQERPLFIHLNKVCFRIRYTQEDL